MRTKLFSIVGIIVGKWLVVIIILYIDQGVVNDSVICVKIVFKLIVSFIGAVG